MNKLSFFFAVLLAFLIHESGLAQDDVMILDSTKTQTLLGKASLKKIGLYVSPEIGFGQYAGATTPIAGGSAMFLLNNKWAIGGAVSRTLMHDFAPTGISTAKDLGLEVNTAGLKVEYSFGANKVFHLTMPVTFGVGGFSIDSLNPTSVPAIDSTDTGFHDGHHKGIGRHNFGGRNEFNNYFGFITPGLNLEVNLMKFAKVYVGASYRIATNLKNNTGYTTVAANDFSGINFVIGTKLGLFEYKVRK